MQSCRSGWSEEHESVALVHSQSCATSTTISCRFSSLPEEAPALLVLPWPFQPLPVYFCQFRTRVAVEPCCVRPSATHFFHLEFCFQRFVLMQRVIASFLFKAEYHKNMGDAIVCTPFLIFSWWGCRSCCLFDYYQQCCCDIHVKPSAWTWVHLGELYAWECHFWAVHTLSLCLTFWDHLAVFQSDSQGFHPSQWRMSDSSATSSPTLGVVCRICYNHLGGTKAEIIFKCSL